MKMNALKSILKCANFNNSSLLLRPAMPDVLSVRFAAVNKPKRNTRQKRKAPGVKAMEGDRVHRGDMIVKQFDLHFHPGLNVSIESDNTLKAMTDGTVMLTVEKINPNESFIAQKYYSNMSAPAVYKRYFHVIPFKQGQKFKLVNVV